MESVDFPPLPRDAGRHSFRLLELLPGRGTESLSCRLHRVSLANNPHYEAISYCWGNSPVRLPLYCNDIRVDITESLHSVLIRLRDETETRMLWADAVCINLIDLEEKTYQVKLMRDIYKNASRVIIWLGEPGEESHLGLALVPRLVEAAEKKEIKVAVRNNLQRSPSRTSPGRVRSISMSLPPIYDIAYKHLLAVVRRPWFRRMWVIQELALAQEASLMCGKFIVSWEDFSKAVEHAVNIGAFTQYNALEADFVFLFNCTRSMVRQQVRQRLLNLLFRHCNCLATDERDNIFALLGLADDVGPDDLSIEPNYFLSNAGEIYKEFAINIMRQDRNLDILSGPVELRNSRNPRPGGTLPSWVPDWSINDAAAPFRIDLVTAECINVQQFEVSGKSICLPEFRNKDDMLGLSGFIFDRIEHIGQTMNHYACAGQWSVDQIRDSQRILIEWETVARARSRIKYPNGEDMLDVYWQTLIAGNMVAGYEATRDQFRKWDEYIRKFRNLHKIGLSHFKWTFNVATKVSSSNYSASPAELRFSNYMDVVIKKRVIRTQGGFVGLAPKGTRVGDMVGIFKGGRVPLVMRPAGKSWKLVGDAYIHGIMRGEAFDERRCKRIWFV